MPRFWPFLALFSPHPQVSSSFSDIDSYFPASVSPEPEFSWPELAFWLLPQLLEPQLLLWRSQADVETLPYPDSYSLSSVFRFMQTKNDYELPAQAHSAITPLNKSCLNILVFWIRSVTMQFVIETETLFEKEKDALDNDRQQVDTRFGGHPPPSSFLKSLSCHSDCFLGSLPFWPGCSLAL